MYRQTALNSVESPKGTKAGTVALLVLATLGDETQIKLSETKFHKNLKRKININDICNLIKLTI